jgi:hypothetical protein
MVERRAHAIECVHRALLSFAEAGRLRGGATLEEFDDCFNEAVEARLNWQQGREEFHVSRNGGFARVAKRVVSARSEVSIADARGGVGAPIRAGARCELGAPIRPNRGKQ